jgi:hypothetical protein
VDGNGRGGPQTQSRGLSRSSAIAANSSSVGCCQGAFHWGADPDGGEPRCGAEHEVRPILACVSHSIPVLLPSIVSQPELRSADMD